MVGALAGLFELDFFSAATRFVVVMMTRGALPVSVAGFGRRIFSPPSVFLAGVGAGAGLGGSGAGGASSLPPPKSFLKNPGLSSARAVSNDAPQQSDYERENRGLGGFGVQSGDHDGSDGGNREKATFYSPSRPAAQTF
jgi:hypothetical protein